MLLVIAVSRYSLEIAHIISHGEIPDHTIAGHTHDHAHGHKHHHHGHHHHHQSHEHQTHTHDFLEVDLNSFHSDAVPGSHHKTSGSGHLIDVFCPNRHNEVYWLVSDLNRKNHSYFREAIWPYEFIKSLLDPPESLCVFPNYG